MCGIFEDWNLLMLQGISFYILLLKMCFWKSSSLSMNGEKCQWGIRQYIRWHLSSIHSQMSWRPTVWINRSTLTTAPWSRHKLSSHTLSENLAMEKSGDWFKVTWLSSSMFGLTFLGKRLFKDWERTESYKAICPYCEIWEGEVASWTWQKVQPLKTFSDEQHKTEL